MQNTFLHCMTSASAQVVYGILGKMRAEKGARSEDLQPEGLTGRAGLLYGCKGQACTF